MNMHCIKVNFSCYGQNHFCYVENDAEKVMYCEGAITELSNTAVVTSVGIVKCTKEDFDEHHYTKIEQFINQCKTYELE